MSLCCLYFILRSGSPASAKLNKCKGKNCFALALAHLRQCQSGSNVVMVICNCIKPQLSYFIVGQRKEWTYVYFHILYRFQLCFKTLYKHFKYKIKILYCGWVPEVFLACSGNFRCWPKADTSSAVGRSHERRSREKNLAKPETAPEKSLAPRVIW